MARIKDRHTRHAVGYEENLRLARTVDENETEPSAVDVDTGNFLAVKIIKAPKGENTRQLCEMKRDVEILARMIHPHIVEFIGFQGWGEPEAEIFMGLKQGTLGSLVRSRSFATGNLGNALLSHMLQALDFLAVQDIVHRDVKPVNILYVVEAGQLRFQLGDFGLSNRISDAVTFAGSLFYMAPEMFQRRQRQTHKVDV
ncbi:hypothetical protein CDD83_3909 [Cordyceps sp. RAO-2017]|nr:hypothetical protein CDD83_3909 [Cordyceps sp. RAO-2017]